MTGKCEAILLAGLSVILGTAEAHENRDLRSWCGDGRLQLLGEFQVAPAQLVTFRDAEACPTGGGPKNCGQFDDDYFAAKTYVASYCVQAHPELAQSRDLIGIRAEVLGPEQFLSDDHHSRYDLGQGVQAVCVACLVAPPVPDSDADAR